MSQIYGYGEDALTYWAITQQRKELLIKLKDDTPSDEALVIYRPSFGRRATSSMSSTGNSANDGGSFQTPAKRAEFGEFDAILATRQATYLIESKWAGSRENQKGRITLRAEQVRRHEVLTWYINLWRDYMGSHSGSLEWSDFELWSDFVLQHGPAFESQFLDKAIASPSHKILMPNLMFLLKLLQRNKSGIPKNILLYFKDSSDEDSSTQSQLENVQGFDLISMKCPGLTKIGYFQMG